MDHIPRGARAEATPTLAASLAAHWRVGPLQAARDLGGTYNLNLLLETGAGAFVARVYRPWVTEQRLRWLHDVRHTLHAEGFPVVPPLPATDGATIWRAGDRLVELERFTHNDGGVDSAAREREAAIWLARFHTWAEHKLSSPVPSPLVANYASPAELLAWLRRLAPRLQHEPAALALCIETHGLLEQLASRWCFEQDRLPRAWTHGDYGGDNVRFRGERVVMIGDWDFLDRRERVFDLAYMAYWSLARSGLEPADRMWERVASLLSAYDHGAQWPLEAFERRAIVAIMARVPLYWVAEAAWLPDAGSAVQAQARGVAHARRLLEQHDRLLRVLAEGGP